MSDPSLFNPGTGTSRSDHFEQTPAPAVLAETARLANKAALFDALARAGITTVTVEFDGAGDSGQIESIIAQAVETPVDLPSDVIPIRQPRRDDSEFDVRPCPVAEAIETLAYDLLEETHGGWEINDGAFGTFTLDVAARSIRLEYNERVMETEYFEHTF